jgi:hypothetical protein
MRILKGLEPKQIHEKIQNGTVVITKDFRFYTSVSLEEFVVGQERFFGVSTKSPIYYAMCELQKGDEFEVNGKHYIIEDAF